MMLYYNLSYYVILYYFISYHTIFSCQVFSISSGIQIESTLPRTYLHTLLSAFLWDFIIAYIHASLLLAISGAMIVYSWPCRSIFIQVSFLHPACTLYRCDKNFIINTILSTPCPESLLQLFNIKAIIIINSCNAHQFTDFLICIQITSNDNEIDWSRCLYFSTALLTLRDDRCTPWMRVQPSILLQPRMPWKAYMDSQKILQPRTHLF